MSTPEIIDRLRRIETKIVRFAEEMGISIDEERDWLTVDDDNQIIRLLTLGRSMHVVLQEAVKKGATKKGHFYDVIYNGKTCAKLLIS